MTQHQKLVITGVVQSLTHHIAYSSAIDNIPLAGAASKYIMCKYCPLYINDDVICGHDENCDEAIYNYLQEGEVK